MLCNVGTVIHWCVLFAFLHTFPGFMPDFPAWMKKKSGSGLSVSATKPKPHFMIYFPKGAHYFWCNVCTTIKVITMTTQSMTTITVMFSRCNRNAVHSSSHHCDVYISITWSTPCCLSWNVQFVCFVCICFHYCGSKKSMFYLCIHTFYRIFELQWKTLFCGHKKGSDVYTVVWQ